MFSVIVELDVCGLATDCPIIVNSGSTSLTRHHIITSSGLPSIVSQGVFKQGKCSNVSCCYVAAQVTGSV